MNDSSRIDLAALLLRVALGVMFLAHGLLKVFVFTPAGTAQFFESLGLPGPLAYVVIAAELAAGVALIAGFRTQLVAALSVPILVGAAWVHIGNGWLFTAKGGGWEYPVFLIVVAIAVALIGDGRYAVRPTPIEASRRPAIA
jgi:putative oxidoreductase